MGNLPGALPMEKICCFLLNDKFSKLLSGKIKQDQLTVDPGAGTVIVRNIVLNPSVFNAGQKSVLLRSARIGNVHIQIPMKVGASVCSFSGAHPCCRLAKLQFLHSRANSGLST
jgi:hypothetical protein